MQSSLWRFISTRRRGPFLRLTDPSTLKSFAPPSAGLLVLLAVSLPGTLRAEPFIEQIDPPVLTRGTINRVTIRGHDLANPLTVWTSSDAPITARPVQAAKPTSNAADRSTSHALDAAILDIDVPADTAIGLYGLRLATSSGLSNLHPFLIDELPVTHLPHAGNTTSAEPRPSQPAVITLPACIATTALPAVIDRFQFHTDAGQRISFEVIGSRFGKDFDPLLTILAADGTALRRIDNSPGLLFDQRFSHTFATAGDYICEVHDVRYSGGTTWNYVLRIGDFPASRTAHPSVITISAAEADQNLSSNTLTLPEAAVSTVPAAGITQPVNDSFPGRDIINPAFDSPASFIEARTAEHALGTWLPVTLTTLPAHHEIEPNNSREQATPIVMPAVINGILQQPNDSDWYALSLTKGQSLEIESVSTAMGSAADLELALFDSTGREHRRSDEVAYRFRDENLAHEARFSFQAGQDGDYFLQVRDMARGGGPDYGYRIHIYEPQPRLDLFCDYSQFTIPRGSWQSLPLTVTRTRCTGPVTLKLHGAPPGVSLTPDVIPADTTEILCRITATADAAPAVGSTDRHFLSTVLITAHWTSDDGTQSTVALSRVHPLLDRQLYNKDRQLYALRENQLQIPPSITDRMALLVVEAVPFTADPAESELILTKYQTATLPISTVRSGSFSEPVRFSASGGQVGDINEERDQIYAVIPDATVQQAQVGAMFHNRINTRYERARCDITATADCGGREITLVRSFHLDVRSAFDPAFEPSPVVVTAGTSTRAQLVARRTPTWSGTVTLTLQRPEADVVLPETIIIPADRESIDVEITALAESRPRRLNVRYTAAGQVGEYEESLNSPLLTIDIKPAENQPK